MNRKLINRWVAITMVVLPLLSGGYRAFAQQTSAKEVPVRELLKMPGRLVSEAKFTRPSGALGLTGYRVEEVRLPRTFTVDIKGQQVAVDRAWRVSVTGGPFPVRALPAVIWIDDEIAGAGIENADLSQITAITFDSSLIHDGGVVSISYGANKDARVRLSQQLQLKREGENQ